MMDILLNELNEDGCKVCAYADDLVIIVEGDRKSSVGCQGTRWLNIVRNWGDRFGVEVSIEKTFQSILTGFFDVRTPPRILLNGNCIKYERVVKYLGVSMSERMNFGVHVDSL